MWMMLREVECMVLIVIRCMVLIVIRCTVLTKMQCAPSITLLRCTPTRMQCVLT